MTRRSAYDNAVQLELYRDVYGIQDITAPSQAGRTEQAVNAINFPPRKVKLLGCDKAAWVIHIELPLSGKKKKRFWKSAV